eukprot:XP_003729510.1 PREDICTED: uncharacterized protein LOC100893986 [Strongylocentrotus purpuratus]
MSSQSEDTEVLSLHDLGGRVTDVDENSATFTAWKSSYETLEAKLTDRSISILRKSTSFKKVVSNVKDFLFEGDEVVINIKQDKTDQTQWNVTRVRLCPDQRPPHYDVVRDYFVRGKQGPARWPKKQRCHVPHARVGEIVSIMSEILQRWCKIPIKLFHDIVDEYGDDQGGVFQSYVKTKRALTSFIRTVPQYFYMDDDDRVCMYEGFDDELFKTEFAEICLSLPQWNRSYPLSEVQVIQTVRDGYAVLQPLLQRAERLYGTGSNPGLVVALDCEGCSLSKTGRLTLVQIATMEGKVYLFDVYRCPYLFHDGLLADFLESEAVLKVIHDCRKDTAALYHQFGITLTNIFDTSIAYVVLQNQCQVAGTKPRPRISFQNLCEMIGEEMDFTIKKSIKKKMVYIPNFWATRPLKTNMINYAAADVYMLLPNVYQVLHGLIHPWKSVFQLMCQDAIRKEIEDI